MVVDDTRSVEQRIARLERSQKKLQSIALVLTLLVVALTGWQFLPGPPEVRVRTLSLMDRQNRNRAELTTWADGTVVFRMNGENEKARAMWRLHRDGAISIRFADEQGHGRLEMRTEGDGTPSLVFGDERGHAGTWIGIPGDGGPAVRTK